MLSPLQKGYLLFFVNQKDYCASSDNIWILRTTLSEMGNSKLQRLRLKSKFAGFHWDSQSPCRMTYFTFLQHFTLAQVAIEKITFTFFVLDLLAYITNSCHN